MLFVSRRKDVRRHTGIFLLHVLDVERAGVHRAERIIRIISNHRQINHRPRAFFIVQQRRAAFGDGRLLRNGPQWHGGEERL